MVTISRRSRAGLGDWPDLGPPQIFPWTLPAWPQLSLTELEKEGPDVTLSLVPVHSLGPWRAAAL